MRRLLAALCLLAVVLTGCWPPPKTAAAIRRVADRAEQLRDTFVPILDGVEGVAPISSWTAQKRAEWADRLEAHAVLTGAVAEWTKTSDEDEEPSPAGPPQ